MVLVAGSSTLGCLHVQVLGKALLPSLQMATLMLRPPTVEGLGELSEVSLIRYESSCGGALPSRPSHLQVYTL